MQASYVNREHMSKYIIIQCLGEYCLEKKVQNLQCKDFFLKAGHDMKKNEDVMM